MRPKSSHGGIRQGDGRKFRIAIPHHTTTVGDTPFLAYGT